MEIIKDLFTKADWKVLFDALVENTTSSQLHWSLDLDVDDEKQVSYLAEPSKDTCVYVVKTLAKKPSYEMGAQQLKRGLWGVLKSEEVEAADDMEIAELFDLVERRVAEPDLQLQSLMKEEFLVDLMGALESGKTMDD
ncbi:hypothetical protein [Pseudarthrobacter sp. PvP090]|uniref:hypothetical protein n=1 Tax=Pseudarthrobacter sp. PvP090 TaxID=3156393 RepID=UPI0033986B4C